MKLFNTSQICLLDKYTIENEPIASIALMERAADRMLQQFKKDWSLRRDIVVLCGPGNNGGDGLALGRMLLQIGYDVQVVLLRTGKLSADCEQNKERLLEHFPDVLIEQTKKFEPVEVSDKTILVDALFGSGLSRSLEGIYADAVHWINSLSNSVVSVDIPSGLDAEKCAGNDEIIVKANVTYTLQFPKLAFFFAENEPFVGMWKVIDIQLHPKAIEKEPTGWHFLEKPDIASKLKVRSTFAHKGNFGHACLMAGSSGMGGAAVISAKAALRAGAGLVTVFGGEENRLILQTAVPEAMYKTELTDIDKFTVLACGPGIGTIKETEQILKEILKSVVSNNNQKHHSKDLGVVLDADALNIISLHSDFWNFIPKNAIFTPHLKEFERLFGACENTLQRLLKAQQKAVEKEIIIVLKGAYTAICSPDGNVYFNSTGNPGMATGGMGDVLTGMMAGLLAQHYTPLESAMIGVYLHGLAADLALENQSEESLLTRDVVENIGNAFRFTKK